MTRFTLCFLASSIFFLSAILTAQSYREIQIKNGGAIHGIVTIIGQAPAPTSIPVSSDTAACGKTKSLDSIVVGPNNGLKNVVVSLEGIIQGKKIPPQVSVELDQEKCEYEPHIVVLPEGANLNIVNSDMVMHNVHAYDLTSPGDGSNVPPTLFNIALPIKGMKIGKQLPKAGMYRLLCDAGHPWMNAYVLVTEHPYFAVTDENGRYTIDNIPPGTYTLKIWHEGPASIQPATKAFKPGEPYKDSRKITVGAGSAVEANFRLQLKPQTGAVEAKLNSH